MIDYVLPFAGMSIGISIAAARVPKVRWLPLASSFVLLFVSILIVLKYRSGSLMPGLVFAGTILVAENLAAGYFWCRERIDPTVSYLHWIRLELLHPHYIRAVYRDRIRAADRRDADSQPAA